MDHIKKKSILIYSVGIVVLEILCFMLLGKLFGKTVGYIVPYGIYLLCLLIGIILFGKNHNKIIKQAYKCNLSYYILAFIPAIATFFVAFVPTFKHLTIEVFIITLIYAILNGTLEELFWRLTYNKVFKKNLIFAYIIPTIIFSCWHFALLGAVGITYEGGALALVGGASIMGLIWGLVMYRTQNIHIVIMAHILTNFFAFSQLIYQNWFS